MQLRADDGSTIPDDGEFLHYWIGFGEERKKEEDEKNIFFSYPGWMSTLNI